MESKPFTTYMGWGVLTLCIVVITYLFSNEQIVIGFVLAILPFAFIGTSYAVQHPKSLLYLLFVENYFLMGVDRYLSITSIGLLTDALFFFTLLAIALYSFYLRKDLPWENLKNASVLLYVLWMMYSLMEIANPTAMLNAWMSGIRSMTLYPLLILTLVPLLLTQFNDMKRIFLFWSLFTVLAVAKMQMQVSIGFDGAELNWLNARGGAITHLLSTGTRYFSFFTDAGNFGSNMGCAMVVFLIVSLHVKKPFLKIFYFVIGLLGMYAMFVSGTRGAIAVPFAGFALYSILSKNAKLTTTMVMFLFASYVFFNFTMIGQSNQYIRRMRSAFNSNEASLVVRQENQRLLAPYMRTRPFGEGLGLSGVDAKRFDPNRLTTNIPNDSWYVKVWVETGIVGLIFYLAIQITIVLFGIYYVLFKIQDKELRGYVSAALCGLFGIMASSYGNAIYGQYPTGIITSMLQAFIFLAPKYDTAIRTIKQ
ncbi:MAG: O-antigen ligase family protein [Bacteroidales bacterium]